MPVVTKAVDVVASGGLTITEYFGNVSTNNANLSACLATVTEACADAYQAPDFDEYVMVISGELHLYKSDEEKTVIKAGEAVFLAAKERVKWVWPGPCQYIPICLPSFTPANCNREAEGDEVKTPEAMARLNALHEDKK
ncbi:unnamed protein product [Polarella glacialis]|uniref:(S)-ureidoglycine aminohydrolase cupin domain-containing protein n=1 Tax=Polarella glacialis TaxID=89957 RepID=A0A813LBJ9_POLGL|nr:unnamed protein product [Polarella glacialis]CAE8648043.1 unnamed protein product [Polarella glacialis]CAE8728139.1 unnamed protein product [Polarella glacialis]|eukprot:CAMPEP_0115109136 /NCGR_PEP_ID=MMETSP0227-20121206/38468_1 /TAXON_ID=89957 /ORGANISM="Polarella glacialis, Strain CCMP 1383" /LENGTH=138 /DNA_ID=CAMNT_0002507661 /DNA_START=49 /DNA_END=465 /DNA_ORIENTATION=+